MRLVQLSVEHKMRFIEYPGHFFSIIKVNEDCMEWLSFKITKKLILFIFGFEKKK